MGKPAAYAAAAFGSNGLIDQGKRPCQQHFSPVVTTINIAGRKLLTGMQDTSFAVHLPCHLARQVQPRQMAQELQPWLPPFAG